METIRYMVDCNLVCAAAHTKGDLRRKKKIKLRKLGHVWLQNTGDWLGRAKGVGRNNTVR
jgi:hypothetical protein